MSEVHCGDGTEGMDGVVTSEQAQNWAKQCFKWGVIAGLGMASRFVREGTGNHVFSYAVTALWNPTWGEKPVENPGDYEKLMESEFIPSSWVV